MDRQAAVAAEWADRRAASTEEEARQAEVERRVRKASWDVKEATRAVSVARQSSVRLAPAAVDKAREALMAL